MGEGTKIEWADATFNPWLGCAKVSAACTNCYAEGWAKRTGSPGLWRGERRRTSAANWRKPLQWNERTPGARVFCASLADVFEERDDLDPWRGDLLQLIRDTPKLTWMLLTKRPEYAARWFSRTRVPGNVWVGTTVEDQERAEERLPHLLSIPVDVRFVSCEPLLGPLDLRDWLGDHSMSTGDGPFYRAQPGDYDVARGLQWVIAGGESGGRARPSHPQWFRTLRDQCEDADVAFHFKQWGEWLPDSEVAVRADPDLDVDAIVGNYPTTAIGERPGNEPQVLHTMYRVGKAAAGRLLDGRTWDEVPA